MSYKKLDDRQVLNRAALPHIGSPAGDSLDDIFSLIDTAIAGVTSNKGYIAKNVALPQGSTSITVNIPIQPDLSYVVFPIMVNAVDGFPQYQQVEVTNKTTTSFTFTWNAPTITSFYSIDFIIPPVSFQGSEVSLGNGLSSDTISLNIPQNGPNYAILGLIQNVTDTNPSFQTGMVTNQTFSVFTESVNAPISTSHYELAYVVNPTAIATIASGNRTKTVTLPINYGSTGYAVVAVMSNTVDSHPAFQPLLITAKNNSQFTISMNTPVLTNNYIITYYAISYTV